MRIISEFETQFKLGQDALSKIKLDYTSRDDITKLLLGIQSISPNKEESDLLFVLLAERYEQRSLVITSNLVFSKWNQIFQDEMTTTAAIDRLVHHATILELNTESYRMNVAKLAKSHSSTTTKIPENNMEKFDVK